MTERENRPSSSFPNLMLPEVNGIGRKNLETLATIQREFLDALNKAHRTWLTYLKAEAALTSDFTKKITTTRSIPDAAAAYQEWVTQQMDLLSKQAREILEETQDFTKACTRIGGNGMGAGTS